MAGVNWDAMPVWPAKRAVAYLGLRRSRVIKIAKGEVELPDSAPEMSFEQEARQYYFDAESVKKFKAWMDKNPDAMTVRRGLPPGITRYRAYLSDEMASEIAELFGEAEGFRLIKAARRPKKDKAEAEAKAGPAD